MPRRDPATARAIHAPVAASAVHPCRRRGRPGPAPSPLPFWAAPVEARPPTRGEPSPPRASPSSANAFSFRNRANHPIACSPSCFSGSADASMRRGRESTNVISPSAVRTRRLHRPRPGLPRWCRQAHARRPRHKTAGRRPGVRPAARGTIPPRTGCPRCGNRQGGAGAGGPASNGGSRGWWMNSTFHSVSVTCGRASLRPGRSGRPWRYASSSPSRPRRRRPSSSSSRSSSSNASSSSLSSSPTALQFVFVPASAPSSAIASSNASRLP